jgi:hypothetical protein
MGRFFLVLSVVVLVVGCAAVQESASPPTRLDTELKRKRLVILPRPEPSVVERDTAAALAELEAVTRREEIVKQVIAPAARPDLDDDVTSGLQGRNLQRALGR